MRKVIKGKTYNTDTADEIYTRGHVEYTPPDFNEFEETLYRTSRGRLFLHGIGGANTPYCSYDEEGSRMCGERIVPKTPGEAVEWLKEQFRDYWYGTITDEEEYERLKALIEPNDALAHDNKGRASRRAAR